MEKKLQRNEQDRVVGGVCVGLGEYFDIDSTWVRIAFVFAAFPGFFGIPAYIILWIAIPPKPFIPFNSGFNPYNADYRVYEEKSFSSASNPNYLKSAEPFPPNITPKPEGNGKLIFGLIFIAFGAFFLLDEFHLIPNWFDLRKLWPLVFIIPGIMMILKAGQDDKREKAMSKEAIFTVPASEQIHPDTDKPTIQKL